MKKILIFSILLILGLLFSQSLAFVDVENRTWIEAGIKNLSLVLLAFIMIHVGIEFSIDKTRLNQYGWDCVVAFTAATLPWLFCAFYFVYVFEHPPFIPTLTLWIDILLLALFAAPTSAGVLFTMLSAAGLEKTWMFKKARILAIFDDLDTIILLIPIKMAIVGFTWEAIGLLGIMALLIYMAWKNMHLIHWPVNWHWILLYSLGLTLCCDALYHVSKHLTSSPIELEILLPSFVLGCMLVHPKKTKKIPHFFDHPPEDTVKSLIGGLFIFLVGLSMPIIEISPSLSSSFWNYKIGSLTLLVIFWHVLAITLITNLGKMFPLFCYRKAASWKERLALSLGMCCRGEVGAGIIIVALQLITHIDQALIIISLLSLVLNLVLTGPLILVIRRLLNNKWTVISRGG